MSSHPDADAFVRAILANPADVTTRLVFADWLEETGDPADALWARFIRAKADAENHPADSPARRDREQVAKRCAEHIRAAVKIPAMLFVAYPHQLLQLLPPANLVARLADFDVPLPVVELIPESVARENLVLPLDQQTRTLLVAQVDPTDRDTVQKLQFILNRDILSVRAEADDVLAAIDRHYGNTETESVSSPHYYDPADEPPPLTVDDDLSDDVAARQLVGLILYEARQRTAERVTISPIGGVYLRFREGGVWSARQELPARLLVPVATRLARLAGVEDAFRDRGRGRGQFLCQVAGGRRLVAALTIETLEEGPVVQLDFLPGQLTTRAEF